MKDLQIVLQFKKKNKWQNATCITKRIWELKNYTTYFLLLCMYSIGKTERNHSDSK